MTVHAIFDAIREQSTKAQEAYDRFLAGTKSASTAARNHLQEIKKLAQDARIQILAERK